MAAVEAPPGTDVAVISKIYPTRSHSGAAQGGLNAAMGKDDSVEDHLFDTVKGGDYLGDQDAIEVLCSEGPEVIRQLEQMGVPWSRTPDGRPAQRSLGGAGFPRKIVDFRGKRVPGSIPRSAFVSPPLSRVACRKRRRLNLRLPFRIRRQGVGLGAGMILPQI